MNILLIEPNQAPRPYTTTDALETMQNIVGGPIQAVYPFEDPIALVCNEEAKLDGMPPNRALRDEDGNMYDIVCGTFFLCAAPPDSENFESLNEEQIDRYTQLFRYPEVFLRFNGRIVAVPVA
ncbi:MAG: DUF3846 domain-containing protein [Prevotella sp.]|nr:DUF3846 domain-containing protein [Prevotella sp.]